ncbi:uncharacterized protein EAF01_011609 [Botrytis porri]|uniref:Uncharacterized protein n=1 Tax=Botrytis porri TaxID=87229 RepID=A0A4Z1KDQ4_9HELO|nr:uncharacterized protein EAF01_011609 [Botrytis porri]KAF7883100.1 hypothetical protein EAF01_011609 [Botrytis porri]TGO84197.1 hypothetical protein BPOR_0536g00050 [Botrytis porri]
MPPFSPVHIREHWAQLVRIFTKGSPSSSSSSSSRFDEESKIKDSPEPREVHHRRYEFTDVPQDVLLGTRMYTLQRDNPRKEWTPFSGKDMPHDGIGRIGTTASIQPECRSINDSAASQIGHLKLFRVSDNFAHFSMNVKGQKDENFVHLKFNLKSFGIISGFWILDASWTSKLSG